MMFPKSLKNMLLLAVALLVTFTGVAISQLVAHRYSVSLLNGAAARAEYIAHKLSLEAVEKILIHDVVSLQKMLDDQIASDPTLGYLFVVRNDNLVTHTFSGGVPADLLNANATSAENGSRIQKILSNEGKRYIDVAYPIFGGRAGTLRLGLSEEPYRREVTQLWLQMSAITLGVLIFSLLVSQLMILRMTRPLRLLTRYAEQIDAGNLDTPIEVEGRSEITKLASAFNSMLIRIQDYTQRLREYNIRLEKKNEELDRAHMQLETAFSISGKISALPRLEQICRFLIRVMRDLVACRDIYLMVFNNVSHSINLATAKQIHHLGQRDYERMVEAFSKHTEFTFVQKTEIQQMDLPESLCTADRIACFPIRHHDLPIGAMMVACADNCRCIKHEIDIVGMILHQAAGAIHRANTHEEELRELRQRVAVDSGFAGIIGKDPKMQLVFKLIEDVAPTDATVLIQGESGTGKELVARAIHEHSHRAQKPFIVINCAAYPSTLLESELFGHEKGAFTGALRRRTGRFEQADGGTVFLDEIGEVEPTAQTKLLRVLQQQTIDRLGGNRPIKVNVRILAATNKDLQEEVRRGRFREDLFYRLNVIPIKLPTLRERPKDIHLLAQHFLDRFAQEQDKQILGFRSDAMRRLIDNQWPGNVRELENCVEHAVVLAKGTQIGLQDLPSSLVDATTAPTSGAARTIIESEERLIREVLETCDWNKAEAARQLGISRSTLYEKLKRLKIVNPTLH